MNDEAKPENPKGTFGPATLDALNILTAKIAEGQQADQARGRLLGVYGDGRGLGEGRFNWDDKTGDWEFIPKDEPA